MRTITNVVVTAAFAAATAGAAACGGDSKGPVPTQPSANASPAGPAASIAGASIAGIGAEVNASAGTVRVRDTVVSVPAGTTIRHSTTTFRLADVRVGDRVEIHGTMNGSTIVAADIEIENEHAPEPGEDHGNPGPNPGPGTGTPPGGDDHGGHGDDNGEAEASGAVAGKGGTGPSIHVSVGSTTAQTNGR